MKKYISCLLVLLALALPMLVMEAQAATTGTCGENVTWSLDGKGTLTITGTGAMADYASASDVPWYASRASVKSVVIKDGVTTIGDRAFYNCAVLTDVTVGSGVETVGTFAFQGCSALGEIVLPAAVTALEDSAFRGCAALETMTFGGNAPALGSYVFRDGASDMTVWYYEGSTGFDAAPWTDYYHETMHVGKWVVDTTPTCTTDGSKHIDCTYCETTITETIPGGHNYVDGVCSVCKKVQLLDSGTCGSNLTWELDTRGVLTISGTGSMEYYYSWLWSPVPWSEHEENIISVIIEEGVTTIGDDAFYRCSSLKEVTIPESVTSIGKYAFYGCFNLTDVYITDIAAWLSISFGDYDANPLEANGLSKKLYLDGKLITNLVIPEGVTTIAEYAFFGCSSLKSVIIPDSVTYIGYDAFSGCSSLESVTIPDSVTTIGDGAFLSCSSLTEITIPEGVTSIDSYTFYDCDSLINITIPESVTSIGDYAFDSCDNLSIVHYGGTEVQAADIARGYGNWYLDKAVWHYGCAGDNCSNLFVDITPGAYYYEPVLWAVDQNITKGTSAITFAPDATCTRGQIVTFLWRANGSPTAGGTNPFTDVPADAWYTDAVLWAVEEGITTGTSSTTFSPDAGCTRGQVATFLWRSEDQPSSDGENIFTDIAPGTYYYDAVLWAVANGITNGVGEGLFAPDVTCTRGQIVTFLYRAMA